MGLNKNPTSRRKISLVDDTSAETLWMASSSSPNCDSVNVNADSSVSEAA